MTNLHQCEVIHSVTVQDHGTCAMIRRLAVPGGWVYEVRALWGEREVTLMMVPDPTAPHCQPTPPADDRPPMTDAELEQWLTATYGEPGYSDRERVTWPEVFQRPHFDSPSAVTMELLGGGKYWHFNDGQQWLPAHVAGPALWAAHRYGNP